MDNCCRICNCSEFFDKYKFSYCKVAVCKSCGLVQVLNGPHSVHHIYSQDYFDHNKLSGPANYLEQKRRLSWLKKCGVKPGVRLLEAGCATGEFLALAERDYNVQGIDVSPFAIQTAVNRYPFLNGRIKADPLECIVLEGEPFDVIVMWDVIEHLKEPKSVIEKISMLLNTGGLIFISTPNFGALTSRILGQKWPFMTPPEHQSFFTGTTLDELMVLCGFSPLRKKNKGKWVNLRFALYKLGRVLGKNRGFSFTHFMTALTPRNATVYAPTEDILYAGYKLEKRKSNDPSSVTS